MCFCCSDNTCKLACPARTRPKGGHEKSYERMTKLSSGPVTPLWESTNSQALPYASKDQLEWTRQAGPGVLDSPLKDGYFQGSGKASDSISCSVTVCGLVVLVAGLPRFLLFLMRRASVRWLHSASKLQIHCLGLDRLVQELVRCLLVWQRRLLRRWVLSASFLFVFLAFAGSCLFLPVSLSLCCLTE